VGSLPADLDDRMNLFLSFIGDVPLQGKAFPPSERLSPIFEEDLPPTYQGHTLCGTGYVLT